MLCTSHERAVEYHAMSNSGQLETGLRDQWMAKAFAFVREANPTMNFFGQLGYAQTMQSPTKTQANTQVGDLDSCMPFATLLNEDSSLSGKICTIQYAYASDDQLADCTSDLDLSDFEPWCGQDTFFNLDSTGSPLWASTALSSIKPAPLRPQRTTSKSYSCSPTCRKQRPYPKESPALATSPAL